MVSPLQSLVANSRQERGRDLGDMLRQQALTDSSLQTQDMQRQNVQQQMNQRSQSMDSSQSLGAVRYINSLGKQLLATPENQWGAILGPNLPQLQQLGYTPETLQNMTREQVEGVVAQTNPLIQDVGQQSSAGERSRAQLKKDLNSEDDRIKRAAEISLGLEGRATGAAPQIVDIGGVPHIFNKQSRTLEPAKIEGQQVTQKTVSESKSTIASAVTEAVSNAKNMANAAGKDRDNSKALDVYDTAMSGLTSALGNTDTGPIAGWLPAVTANQQIAEGAVAAMAPILKQVFRSSGEGTFTDSDQRLLMQMVPTRKDRPESRKAKIENIDAIVRAKLVTARGSQLQEEINESPAPEQPAQTTGFKIISIE